VRWFRLRERLAVPRSRSGGVSPEALEHSEHRLARRRTARKNGGGLCIGESAAAGVGGRPLPAPRYFLDPLFQIVCGIEELVAATILEPSTVLYGDHEPIEAPPCPLKVMSSGFG